jgi:hypothetical protein
MSAEECAEIIDHAVKTRAIDHVAVFGLKVAWYFGNLWPRVRDAAARAVMMPPEVKEESKKKGN